MKGEVDAATLVQEADLGGRKPVGFARALLAAVCIGWSLLQLWYASPLLAYLAFPFAKRSPRDRIPAQDWLFATVAGFCGAYLFLFYREIATRPGQPTTLDNSRITTARTPISRRPRRA